MREFFALFILAFSLYAPLSAHAKIIQILHTNDLHAALTTYGAPAANESEYGGWAQIKTVLDRLTAEAKEKGIETLKLDAGDFSEGTMAYFADNGENVIRAFQAMGYEAATLGNHDWLMGARGLNTLYGKAPFAFPILGANLKISPRLENLSEQIVPTTQIIKDGVKIGIVGLTTNEAFYKWITKVDSYKNDLKIKPYIGYARKAAYDLSLDNDFVIALTHLGFDEDRKLARDVSGINLIVGGHSHTTLEALAEIENPDGESVPIVQTGYNGKFIGKVLIEVIEGKKPRVLTYELVPVYKSEALDPNVAALLDHAKARVEEKYTPAVLNEKVGKTEVRLVSGTDGPTAFAKFAADSMRSETGADVSIDIGSFHGNTTHAAGDVTRQTLMEMYPRKFENEQNEGWYVYHSYIAGWVLKLGIQYAVKYGFYASVGGMTFDVEKISDDKYAREIRRETKHDDLTSLTQYRAINIRMNGQPLCNFCRYLVAAPEGIIRGAYSVSVLTHLIIHKGYETETTIWDAMQSYLSKIGVIQKLNPDEHFNGQEFSNRNLARVQQNQNGEQFKLDWVNDHNDGKAVFEKFLKDVKERIRTGNVEE